MSALPIATADRERARPPTSVRPGGPITARAGVPTSYEHTWTRTASYPERVPLPLARCASLDRPLRVPVGHPDSACWSQPRLAIYPPASPLARYTVLVHLQPPTSSHRIRCDHGDDGIVATTNNKKNNNNNNPQLALPTTDNTSIIITIIIVIIIININNNNNVPPR